MALLLVLLSCLAMAIQPRRGAEYLGAGNGTMFRVYAPHATKVSVAGEWNSWSATAHPLQKGEHSVWFGQIPLADRWMNYKFVINDTKWNMDPNSIRVENSGYGSNSIIEDLGYYQWSANEANWQSGAHLPSVTQMVIYELHLKSFMFKNDGVPYEYGGFFRKFVEHKLDYLQDLGINAISLMPINEFPGDQSWGYNPAFWFAVESAYGSPYDFQYFVDQCHQRGIAVIVDVCYNHAGPNDISHYWDFDGGFVNEVGGNGNYFYTDWRGLTPWGATNPDWGQGHVRDMLVENAKMWILDYHCDGLRVDSTVSIRKDSPDGWDWNGSDNPDGWSFLQYLTNETRPLKGGKTVMIAEDIAGNSWITKNTGEGGAGFTAQWQPSPIVGVVTQWDDNSRDMNEVARAIGASIGTNYGFHEIVKYHSSHDTVDARNDHWRLPNLIGDPFQWYAWKRSKLAMGIILGAPGTPMIFMGDEFYSKGQWDDDPDHSVDWAELDANRPFWNYTHAMIRLKTGGRHGAMATNSLEIPVIDNGMKIISWKRWDNSGNILIFAANFRGSEQTRNIPFPLDGTWYEIVNSDAASFGGDNVGNGGSINAAGGSANVRIGSYSLIVFARQKDEYPAAKARNPHPWNNEPGVSLNPALSWDYASDASSYNVIFGTDRTAVENAGEGSPEWRGNQTGREYAAQNLNTLTDYFWRIDTVNASGAVTKGDVWQFITGDGNSGSLSRAVWTPEFPMAGEDITIHYYAETGPLAGSSAMTLHWGVNNWDAVLGSAMTQAAPDHWTITVAIPGTADVLDFVFTNGTSWDNNSGADWHVPVRSSSPRVEWTPAPPVEGEPMTILYHADMGILKDAAQIYIHLGFDIWAAGTVIHVPLVKASGNDWTYTLNVPMGKTQVDFVFANGTWPDGTATVWDNNSNMDWHVPVATGDIPAWGVSNPHLRPMTRQGFNPPEWSLQIWNAGKGTLNWTVSRKDTGFGTEWFSLNPTSGSSTGPDDREPTIAVTFQAENLEPGDYKARIVAKDSGGLLPDLATSITLTVQPLAHIVTVPPALSIERPTSGTAEAEFTISNSREGTLPFTAAVVNAGMHPWLTVSPTSGTSYGPPATVHVKVEAVLLPEGDATGEIEVTAPYSDNSPLIVPVYIIKEPDRSAWSLY